jgi:molybdopterin converting factor small subunit
LCCSGFSPGSDPGVKFVVKIHIEYLSSLPNTLQLKHSEEDLILENVKGITVRKLLGYLALKYPQFNELFFDGTYLRPNGSLTIFCNSRRLELLAGLETGLNDGDVITLMLPSEGG